MDENLILLRDQILSGKVDVGHYHYFTIHDPKERVICAASFPERVLHHAIMNICHPYFDRTLIYDTYATRIGKGTYKALDRAREGARKYKYVAKMDVRKYFDSVNHLVLKQYLQRLFKDQTLLTIFNTIIDSYHTTEGCGIPIGNLTSQYFANLYLSNIDHREKEQQHIPLYIRYMDDILIFSNDKQQLKSVAADMQEQMRLIGLTLKPVQFLRTEQGVHFLGYRVYPHKMLLSGRSKRRFAHKFRLYEHLLQDGTMTEYEYLQHILPLLAFTQKAYTKQFRQRLCMEALTASCGAGVGTTTRGTVASRIATTTPLRTVTTTTVCG